MVREAIPPSIPSALGYYSPAQVVFENSEASLGTWEVPLRSNGLADRPRNDARCRAWRARVGRKREDMERREARGSEGKPSAENGEAMTPPYKLASDRSVRSDALCS